MSKLTMTRRAFVAAGSLLLAGCGAKEEPAQTQPAEEAAAEQKPAEDAPAAEATSTGSAKDKRILVAFYSRADENYPGEWLEVGHTKVMARRWKSSATTRVPPLPRRCPTCLLTTWCSLAAPSGGATSP